MSYPRAGRMRVCKTGITIIDRYHLGIPCVRKAFCLLGFLSCDKPDDLVLLRGLPESRVLKEKEGYLKYVAVEPHCGPRHRCASAYAHGILSA